MWLPLGANPSLLVVRREEPQFLVIALAALDRPLDGRLDDPAVLRMVKVERAFQIWFVADW